MSGREEMHFRCQLGWRTGPAGRGAGWMGLGLESSCPKLGFTSVRHLCTRHFPPDPPASPGEEEEGTGNLPTQAESGRGSSEWS